MELPVAPVFMRMVIKREYQEMQIFAQIFAIMSGAELKT
jgi:hypothetical protein